MARLQILQLPEGIGDKRPPFVLVIDQLDESLIHDFVGASEITAERIGARSIFAFTETIHIPANDPLPMGRPGEGPSCIDVPGCDGQCCDRRREDQAERHSNELAKQLAGELAEARLWARHGYEIGQKHCGWVDHGVAPAWLTDDWPPHFDTCEHLQRAGAYDEALTRVRALPEEPKFMDALHENGGGYRHGYRVAIGDAKRAARVEQPRACGDGG
ncbi:hypothetical protein [Streptomyces sp. NPDC051997]|uniref:hypothetical protein n=1 Tax=Streptomyces sp. NPDC051997 TaxID=3155611 RepID=UPI00341CF4E6